MAALPLILTDAGLAKIVDAEGGGLAAIVIAEIGLTNTAFEASEDTDELPDEIKRLDAVSGAAVDDKTVHLTARDTSDDEYEFSGFGVYLDDGTLFGVYSQDDAIAGKAEVSFVFLAFDFKLSAPVAELFQFGDANFLNPPATEETLGVVRRATLAEVQAGEDGEKFVSPELLAAVYVALEQLGVANGVATLGGDGKLTLDQRPPYDPVDFWPVETEAEMLALGGVAVGDWAIRTDLDPTEIFVLQELPATNLAHWLPLTLPAPVSSVNGKVGVVVLTAADVGAVPTARTIAGSGLAQGGGALNANRTIDVPKASPAEVLAGVDDSKAVTPLGIAGLLNAIGAGVPSTRQITGGGIATGGGSLAADRVITVPKASAAEALAAADDTKAVTPLALSLVLAAIAAKVAQTLQLTTSGLVTGGGALSANRNFDVAKASAAEALAGEIDTKAVTPASLASILVALAAKAPLDSPVFLNTPAAPTPPAGNNTTRLATTAFVKAAIDAITSFALKTVSISAGGIATGGGTLAADRTITVTKATGALIAAGTDDTKAVTPKAIADTTQDWNSVLGLGGSLIKHGTVVSNAGAAVVVNFPAAFATSCENVLLTPRSNADDGDEDDEPWWVTNITKNGFTLNRGGDGPAVTFGWTAFGH